MPPGSDQQQQQQQQHIMACATGKEEEEPVCVPEREAKTWLLKTDEEVMVLFDFICPKLPR